MKKLLDSCKKLAEKLGFHAAHRKTTNQRHNFCKPALSLEALESRQLLSITLHWAGNGVLNTPQIWDTTSANWTTDGRNRVAFSNAIDYDVKFDYPDSPKDVQIACDVQPASITFGWSDFNLFTTNDSRILARGSNPTNTLPIKVEQRGLYSDYKATIDVAICDLDGTHKTRLEVGGNTQTVTPGGELYPTGRLVLTGNNTYTGETHITNYENPYIGGDWSGGVLVAGHPNALPKNGDYYRYIMVEEVGTLAVESDGTANKWTEGTITSFLHDPNNDPFVDFQNNSNFGISVDAGKSFEYAGSIPDKTPSENSQNFVKLDIGTLTLSGENEYGGTTTINKGTLLAMKPGALPNHETQNKIVVKNVGTAMGGYGDYDTEDVTTPCDGTKYANSTLAVQADATGASGWDRDDVMNLLYNGTTFEHRTKFEDNTYFGIKVGEGVDDAHSTFSVVGDNSLWLGMAGNASADSTVGFVKMGAGTLEFGARADHGVQFAGPVAIYEGTLKAAGNGCRIFPGGGVHTGTGNKYPCPALFIGDRGTFDINSTTDTNAPVTRISELHGKVSTISDSGCRITSRNVETVGNKCSLTTGIMWPISN